MADQPNCNKGTRSRRNCYPQWDNFPCWVKEEMACYNNTGDTQLFDPLADILRSLSYVVEYVYNAFTYEIDNIPQQRERQEAGEHFFQFLNDFSTTLQPIQNPTLRNLDLVRYYNSDQYLGMAENYVNRLGNVIRELRQGGNMNSAIAAIQQPPRLQRVPSQERGGSKRKTRIKRNKKRKTRKNKRK